MKKSPNEEKILTKHPLGKRGVNISQEKYDAVKKAIVAALRKKQLTHTELSEQVNQSLANKFDGNINWYNETVKLDLEARKMIERTSTKPPKYRLKKSITNRSTTQSSKYGTKVVDGVTPGKGGQSVAETFNR